MRNCFAGLPAVLFLALIGTAQAAPPSPVSSFLQAADTNDVAAMKLFIDRGGASFLKTISKCYLRRVYSNGDAVTAAWMCAEGPSQSRVILANVAQKGDKVSVSIQQNSVNKMPAPERTKSALAE